MKILECDYLIASYCTDKKKLTLGNSLNHIVTLVPMLISQILINCTKKCNAFPTGNGNIQHRIQEKKARRMHFISNILWKYIYHCYFRRNIIKNLVANWQKNSKYDMTVSFSNFLKKIRKWIEYAYCIRYNIRIACFKSSWK